jgi:diguanylate cyclase (GGDEF)-like protein/PAS domain S-box-containing protein
LEQDQALKPSFFGRVWFPLLVLALGVALSAILCQFLLRSVREDAADRLELQAEQAKNALAARIQAYTDALYAVRALFQTSAHVTQQDFRQFVATLELDTRYPALRILNYAAYVKDNERPSLVAQIRADTSGEPRAQGFTIQPPQVRPAYYVITHLAPFDGNERSFGLDIGAPPFKPDALEYGRDTGRLVSSGRIIRFEDGVDNLAMRIAVYRSGYPTETLEQRRAAYIGSVGAGFRIAQLMRGVLEAHNLQHIHLTVLDVERSDGKRPEQKALIFENGVVAADAPRRVYAARREIEMGGRHWELDFRAPESRLVSDHDLQLPWVVFVGGALTSLLLASILFLITSSRHRALVLARRINQDLHVQEGRLADAQRIAHLGSWEISGQSRHMLWSEELYRMLGVERGTRVALDDFLAAVHPRDRQKVRDMLRLSSDPGSVLELEHRLRLTDGTERWALTKAKLEEPLGEGGVWRGTTMDITERKRAEATLQTEHQITRILAAGGEDESVLPALLKVLCTRLNMACAVQWLADGQHALRCERVWCSDKVDRSERVHMLLQASGSQLARAALQKRELVPAALQTERRPLHVGGVGGEPVALYSAVAFPIVAANTVLGVIELFSEAPTRVDASVADLLASIGAQLGQHHQRTLAEDALKFVAAHDALTGLPNRLEFQDQLEGALRRARRERSPLAVVFIDLDRFKLLNDSIGHGAGDRFLQECARRIKDALRQSDTAARIGGDEFVVMLEGMDKPQDITAVVQKLLDQLKEPFLAEGREFAASASIGISMYPADGIDSATLIKHADMAMVRAKQQVRGSYRFFATSMNEEMERRFTLEADLRRALARDEFVVYYQPRVDARSGRITGAEALLRWRHPERGIVAPGEFIPLAEETGLIVPIGEWVLKAACARARQWKEEGFDLRVSVNLSARQFAEKTLVEDVARALRASGLAPEALELEITETVVMQTPAQAAQTLEELKGLRVGLSLDDFGIGYSSLSYLKMFPFDALKIDRAFVAGIPADREDVAIAEAVIYLAHALNMRAIAEGVETEEQAQWLSRFGCEELQGDLLAEAMPIEALTPLLQESRSRWRAPVSVPRRTT